MLLKRAILGSNHCFTVRKISTKFENFPHILTICAIDRDMRIASSIPSMRAASAMQSVHFDPSLLWLIQFRKSFRQMLWKKLRDIHRRKTWTQLLCLFLDFIENWTPHVSSTDLTKLISVRRRFSSTHNAEKSKLSIPHLIYLGKRT